MHLAAIEGNADLIRLLLGHGAKTDLISSLGDTPLVLATLHGHTAAVAAILESCPDPGVHQQGVTALGLAIVNQSTEIAQLLLAAGVSPVQILKGGQTPLIISAIHGNLELVRSIVDAKVDLNIQDDSGATALMWATYRRHHRVIELLLAAGCDRTCKNPGGLTALDLAQMNRDRSAIALLTTI